MISDTRRADIGTRLRAARTAARLSQADVALDLGVTRQAVSSWEAGRSSPTAVQLGDLAMAYGSCAHRLLFGSSVVSVAREEYEAVLGSLTALPAATRRRCQLALALLVEAEGVGDPLGARSRKRAPKSAAAARSRPG